MIYLFDSFELDEEDFCLTQAGQRVPLEPKCLRVLLLLVQSDGRLLEKNAIIEAVWKDTFVEETTLTRAIALLRKQLGDDPRKPRFIETVPTLGYRFIAKVETRQRGDRAAAPAEAGAPPEAMVASLPDTPTEVSSLSALTGMKIGDGDARERTPLLQAADDRRRAPSEQPTAARPQKAFYNASLVAAVLLVALAIGAGLWARKTEYFWRSPIAGARYSAVTDFGGLEQAAALSRDGNFIAFLSDRDGPMDIWVTQVGSGEFHNLTHGRFLDIPNPFIRVLGFSPDGSLVTFWLRKPGGPSGGKMGSDISVWAVPTLGGDPRPYLDGVAEFDWLPDGSQLIYHTSGAGDPLFVSNGTLQPADRPIYTAAAGLHSHFPIWASGGAFIYFVGGTPPDKLDIWRIRRAGGTPERITSYNGVVSYPVFADQRTLLYLAGDPDGSGPWLYSMDVDRRIPHRLSSDLDRYTSLAASADGHRLAVTVAKSRRTLWSLRLDDASGKVVPAQIPLATSTGYLPRLGPDYLLYVSATAAGEGIWKFANGVATELWNGQDAEILGGPAISPDGRHVAFAVRQQGRTLLCAMEADGSNAYIVADSLELRGDPAWSPDGQSLITAADVHGTPQLFRVPIRDRMPMPFLSEPSMDPLWSPDGRFVLYSGPDIGTRFQVKAVTAAASTYALPPIMLTRGTRHLAFLPGGKALVVLRGEILHKELWLIDLESGAERQLTSLPLDFDVQDFDLSRDGNEVVLERMQSRSDVVLLDLPRP